MTKPRLCIDIDNVISQTDAVVRRVIREYTQGRVNLQYDDIKEFNYHECKDSAGEAITTEEWKEVHREFSREENLMTLLPYQGIQEAFGKLAQTFSIHLATSRLHQARGATIEWLEQHHFPAPYDLHFLRHGEKHAALTRFFAAVEDDYKQAALFTHSGTKCYLIRHPWNREKEAIPELHWVEDWAELAPHLLVLADVWEMG